MLKLAIHIKAAASLQDVAGADGSCSAEGFPYVDFIVLLKEGTVNDTEDVLLMILPVCARLPLGDLGQLKMQTVNSRNVIFLFKHGGDGGFIALIDLPQEGIEGSTPGAGVGYIEHIAQRKLPSVIVQQGDALGTSPYIAVHGVIPQIVLGASSGVGPLGMNQQLVTVLVFVQSGRRGQIGSPAAIVAGNLPRCVLRQLYVG